MPSPVSCQDVKYMSSPFESEWTCDHFDQQSAMEVLSVARSGKAIKVPPGSLGTLALGEVSPHLGSLTNAAQHDGASTERCFRESAPRGSQQPASERPTT